MYAPGATPNSMPTKRKWCAPPAVRAAGSELGLMILGINEAESGVTLVPVGKFWSDVEVRTVIQSAPDLLGNTKLPVKVESACSRITSPGCDGRARIEGRLPH